ncbi:MAG: NAD-dependent epimerase/dehydratase family protein, partial [Bacteroidetes bacterium]|nr:NAD-dependent epimerase/dehydratase family protein [Bacteroidota bacterium]
MLLRESVKRIFITGGAGFIGSHVAEILVHHGYEVTVYDNLSNGKLEYIEQHLEKLNFNFIQADLLEIDKLNESIKNHDLIWHLAANTDIINSSKYPRRDIDDGIISTFNLLEAMRKNNLKKLIFSSTGAVYGNLCYDVESSEETGPLLPVSTYAAGKISCEAFISSYCELFGFNAWMYRFGNVLGARMTHGVIYDFIHRLKENPVELLIKGDGTQEKNYFLVEECILGMIFGFNNISLSEGKTCDIYNLGTNSITKVIDIAKIVIYEMGLKDVKINIEGAAKAWPGDQPKVHISVDRMKKVGWATKLSSDEAVRIA